MPPGGDDGAQVGVVEVDVEGVGAAVEKLIPAEGNDEQAVLVDRSRRRTR